MKDALRATGFLGTRQLVAITAAIASAKAWAVFVGPAGVGLGSLLNSLVALAGLVAGLGVTAGVVRFGSRALASRDEAEFGRLLQAAVRILAVSGVGVAAGMVVTRAPIARRLLEDGRWSGAVVWVAVALLFNLIAGIAETRLTVRRRVGLLARTGIVNSVASAGIGIFAVWRFGIDGIAPAMAAAAATSAVVVVVTTRMALGRFPEGSGAQPEADPAETISAPVVDPATITMQVRRLLRWGLPYTGSQAVGSGMALLLPLLVLHLLDQESVGLHRAAVALSTTYLALLLEALSRDYYPRVSGLPEDDPERLAAVVDDQLRLVLGLGIPFALGLMTAAPWLLPLFYTADFLPALPVLEWQLVGDIFKVAAWCLSIAILSRAGSGSYFRLELLGGLLLLGGSWGAVWWFGFEGIGIGFLAAYLLFFLIALRIARARLGISPSRTSWALLGAGAGALLLIRSLPELGLPGWRLPVGVAATAIATAVSVRWVVRTMRG